MHEISGLDVVQMMGDIRVHCAYDKMVPISDIRPHPKNRNRHPDEQIKRLAKIISANGMRRPVVVSERSGYIVAGHGRVMALKELGAKYVPVNFQDYESDEQEYQDLIADNASALWAELDFSAINVDIGDLGPFDLDLLGIRNFEVDVADKDPGCDEDEAPAVPADTRVVRGDVFVLGRHRLMCGDSTMINDIDALMAGEKADLWITDPPYGVDYVAKNAAVHGGIVKNAKGNQITNDTKSVAELCPFWRDVATSAYAATTDKAAHYWFACQGSDKMMMMMMMDEAGWNIRHELIWVKSSFVFGRSDYHYRHEPIIYGWKKDGTHEWCGDRKQDSVFEVDRPHRSDMHPTTKPVELIERLIRNSSHQSQLVLDTFGGSGTTLIAAEKAGRRSALMEIDPKYCAVILERYAKYAGEDPIRESDGRLWSEIQGAVAEEE